MPKVTHPAVGHFSLWPYRLALLTTACTVLLLFVGGLVTSLGVGLAVPDWPTTFGYNLFLFPWSKMVGGIFYEHSHRLVGSVVGFLTVLLAVALWYTQARRLTRWLGLVALGAVIVQGVLGGLRVLLLEQLLAIVHACLAQAFFALAASLMLLTSGEWQDDPVKQVTSDANRIRRLSIVTAGLIYVQLIVGAILRHTGGGVELHIIGAVFVAVAVFGLADRMHRSLTDQSQLVRSAVLLRRLLLLQLTLGLAAYSGKFPASRAFLEPFVVVLATSHVVVGALMFATCIRLSLRVYRFLEQPQISASSQFVSEQVPV